MLGPIFLKVLLLVMGSANRILYEGHRILRVAVANLHQVQSLQAAALQAALQGGNRTSAIEFIRRCVPSLELTHRNECTLRVAPQAYDAFANALRLGNMSKCFCRSPYVPNYVMQAIILLWTICSNNSMLKQK